MAQDISLVPQFLLGRLRAQTPSGGSGPLRRACAPFAAKAAQGCRRQTPAAARGYALFWRSGLRPSLVRGDTPRNAPLQNHASSTVRHHTSRAASATCRRHPKGLRLTPEHNRDRGLTCPGRGWAAHAPQVARTASRTSDNNPANPDSVRLDTGYGLVVKPEVSKANVTLAPGLCEDQGR